MILGSQFLSNLPDYPIGQKEKLLFYKLISKIQLSNDFEKPAKEDLVIYEVLIRDFDSDRISSLIDKIEF